MVTPLGFWVASERKITVNDPFHPVESLNFLLLLNMDGVIEEVVPLPDAVNNIQLRFGFEGVTVGASTLWLHSSAHG